MTGENQKKKHFTHHLKVSCFVLFFTAIALYAIFESRWLLSGPVLILTSPSDGEVFESPLITVSGETNKISYIYLNDTRVYVDDYGKFSYEFLLMPGYNIITVKALNRYGEEIIKTAEVVYTKNGGGKAALRETNIANRTLNTQNEI